MLLFRFTFSFSNIFYSFDVVLLLVFHPAGLNTLVKTIIRQHNLKKLIAVQFTFLFISNLCWTALSKCFVAVGSIEGVVGSKYPRGGVLPYNSYTGMCCPTGPYFWDSDLKRGIMFKPFSRTGYNFSNA